MSVPRSGPNWTLLVGLWVLMMALRQNPWFAREPQLVLGVLPAELAYQALYSLVVAGVMAWLVRVAWPRDLEALDEPTAPAQARDR